jgi:hypothetical protein
MSKAPRVPEVTAEQLREQIMLAAGKEDVLKQALVQREGTIHGLKEEVEDAKLQMEEVRKRMEAAQAALNVRKQEFDILLKENDAERRTLATTLFEGMTEENLRAALSSDEYQRWCLPPPPSPSPAVSTVSTTVSASSTTPAYPSGAASSAAVPVSYGAVPPMPPPMPMRYGYPPQPYPYNSTGYGYPYPY